MLRSSQVGRVVLRLSAVAILTAAACGQGTGSGGCGGCGGCGDGTYVYPENDPNRPDAILQSEVARARITQGFIDFIQPQLPAIIKAGLDGQSGLSVDSNDILHISLPNQDLFNVGVAEAKLRDAEALIWLDDLEQKVSLEFERPNSVRLKLENLRLGVMMKLKENALGTTSSCPVEGRLGMGPIRHAAEITVDTEIDPGVGAAPMRLLDIKVSIDDVALNDLAIRVAGSSVYCQEPECRDCAVEVAGTCLDVGGRCVECRIFCGALTDGLLQLVGALVNLVEPLLNRVMKPVIQNFIDSALADFNNQPAKLEMQLDLGTLLQIPAFDQANPFGLFIAPEVGRFPVIDRGSGDGMEITATGGAEAELADCIGALPPFDMPKGPVPVLGGTDSKGRPYHVGFTLSSSWINQILYAVHRSGSLCVKLGSEDIRDLTGGQFSLNASVLSLLASDLTLLAEDGAPVILQLKPRNPPRLDLGSGEVTGQDAMGNDVRDHLFKLNLEDMGLAFHVLIHDRYVRVFEVTLDVNVGLDVMVLPDNSLEAAVGELRIDDFNEVFNEALPNADFAMVLPTLIDLALQALVSNQLSFNVDISDTLSTSLGGAPIFMRINEIQRDGIQEDFVTMTVTFSSTTATTALSLAAETFARLDEDDDLHTERAPGDFHPTGRVRLEVGEPLSYTDQRALEYQVRVDQGMWHAPMAARPDGTIRLADSHFMLPGRHTVEVRSRYAEDYTTLDPTPTVLEVLVDPLAPNVRAVVADEAVQIRVSDEHSPADTLALEGRLDDGAWQTIDLTTDDEGATAQFPLVEVGDATQLELQARDGIGNVSEVVRVRVGYNPQADDDLAAEPGCACDAAPGSSRSGGAPDGMSLGVAALLGCLLLRRRRRL